MGMPNVTSKGLVLVMNSIAVIMGGTWVKFEEVRGSGSPSSSRVWTQKNISPSSCQRVVQLGLEPNLCLATLVATLFLLKIGTENFKVRHCIVFTYS
jgi:hypothetical protein